MYSTRFATEADIDSIVSLVQSAYRGETSRAGWTTEADLIDGQRTDAEEVAELLALPNSHMLVCEQGARLLASLHLQDRGSHAYLGMFAVRPDKQGQGLGKFMLARAEQQAFDVWHKDTLQMTVISLRQDLIAWYQRRGYRLSDEYVAFPYGEPRFGLPRRDDLVLQVLCKQVGDYTYS